MRVALVPTFGKTVDELKEAAHVEEMMVQHSWPDNSKLTVGEIYNIMSRRTPMNISQLRKHLEMGFVDEII